MAKTTLKLGTDLCLVAAEYQMPTFPTCHCCNANDFISSPHLLKLNKGVSVHQRNLQYLMIEIYKIKNGLNLSVIRELFKPRDTQYNLRNKNTLGIPKIKTTSNGIETVQYMGQKLRQMLPPNF